MKCGAGGEPGRSVVHSAGPEESTRASNINMGFQLNNMWARKTSGAEEFKDVKNYSEFIEVIQKSKCSLPVLGQNI